jgi:hypothetical protein
VDAVVVCGVPAGKWPCPGGAVCRRASTGVERECGGDAGARGFVTLWASRVSAMRALARHGRVLGVPGRACADACELDLGQGLA